MFLTITIDTSIKKGSKFSFGTLRNKSRSAWRRPLNLRKRSVVQRVKNFVNEVTEQRGVQIYRKAIS